MEPILDEDGEEVVKEMFGGSIPRVDPVRGPASGLLFSVLKAGAEQDSASISDVQSTPPTKESSVTKSNEVAPAADSTDPELVLKADETPSGEDLDPTEVLAEPAVDAPGDVNEPGSPAWEAIDAATARKWTSILARAKNALGVMGDRELQEVAAGNGDGGDVDSAFDLSDACDAVDYAISILAPFAVDEQSEADSGSDAMASVNKALGHFDPEALDLVEQLAPVKKAGRVLSSSNEQAIRDAVTSLQGVLSSLPQAPTAEPVAKSQEPDVADAPTDPEAEPVAKAKDDPAPMVACYDAGGNLIGVVAEGDLTAVASGTPVDPDAAKEPDPAPADPETPAVDPAAVAEPAAVDPEAVPVAKSAEENPDLDSAVESAVAKALEKRDEEHEVVIKSLTDRLAVVESQPAGGGPLLSGVPHGGMTPSGTRHVALRGQSGEVNPEFAAVQKALSEETDPVKLAELRRQADFLTLRAAYGGPAAG